MNDWIRWSVPPAIVMSIGSPAYAHRYLTVEEAQRMAFPAAHFHASCVMTSKAAGELRGPVLTQINAVPSS